MISMKTTRNFFLKKIGFVNHGKNTIWKIGKSLMCYYQHFFSGKYSYRTTSNKQGKLFPSLKTRVILSEIVEILKVWPIVSPTTYPWKLILSPHMANSQAYQ
jgi:hypothetical protein